MPVYPEQYWSVNPAYKDAYDAAVAAGRRLARYSRVNIVGIARNAMPTIENTLELIDELRRGFNVSRTFVYENDSTDGTTEVLAAAAERLKIDVRSERLGLEDTRGFERSRTERLAAARTKCHEWVRSGGYEADFTIVLDMDPAGGFSVDGVFNSIWQLSKNPVYMGRKAGAMASYSLWVRDKQDGSGGFEMAHYDAWAARPLCYWEDRREQVGGLAWFSLFLPPVGSEVIPMNSAFGGLCVYRTDAYLAGVYDGNDCEHVGFHKSMQEEGFQLYLNPGCRYFAVYAK
jgi:hypothetical protein